MTGLDSARILRGSCAKVRGPSVRLLRFSTSRQSVKGPNLFLLHVRQVACARGMRAGPGATVRQPSVGNRQRHGCRMPEYSTTSKSGRAVEPLRQRRRRQRRRGRRRLEDDGYSKRPPWQLFRLTFPPLPPPPTREERPPRPCIVSVVADDDDAPLPSSCSLQPSSSSRRRRCRKRHLLFRSNPKNRRRRRRPSLPASASTRFRCDDGDKIETVSTTTTAAVVVLRRSRTRRRRRRRRRRTRIRKKPLLRISSPRRFGLRRGPQPRPSSGTSCRRCRRCVAPTMTAKKDTSCANSDAVPVCLRSPPRQR